MTSALMFLLCFLLAKNEPGAAPPAKFQCTERRKLMITSRSDEIDKPEAALSSFSTRQGTTRSAGVLCDITSKARSNCWRRKAHLARSPNLRCM